MSEVYEVTTQAPQESSASTGNVSGYGPIIIIWVARCAFAAIFVVAWQVVATRKVINPLFIGVPSEIAKYFWDGLFVNHSMVIDLRGRWREQRRPLLSEVCSGSTWRPGRCMLASSISLRSSAVSAIHLASTSSESGSRALP